MPCAPRVLLETTIANLRTLAAFFADEIGHGGRAAPDPNPEAQACREALLTIHVLIPKLQAARYRIANEPTPGCIACDSD